LVLNLSTGKVIKNVFKLQQSSEYCEKLTNYKKNAKFAAYWFSTKSNFIFHDKLKIITVET
jgi:hypothetical protein